jgi:hypothetical protein
MTNLSLVSELLANIVHVLIAINSEIRGKLVED